MDNEGTSFFVKSEKGRILRKSIFYLRILWFFLSSFLKSLSCDFCHFRCFSLIFLNLANHVFVSLKFLIQFAKLENLVKKIVPDYEPNLEDKNKSTYFLTHQTSKAD